MQSNVHVTSVLSLSYSSGGFFPIRHASLNPFSQKELEIFSYSFRVMPFIV